VGLDEASVEALVESSWREWPQLRPPWGIAEDDVQHVLAESSKGRCDAEIEVVVHPFVRAQHLGQRCAVDTQVRYASGVVQRAAADTVHPSSSGGFSTAKVEEAMHQFFLLFG
jgi:hypothetical protein